MRRTTGGLIALGVAAGAAGVTAVVVEPSSSLAEPLPRKMVCGDFEGFGPAPGCSYTQVGANVQVFLHNNGQQQIPVRCTLTWPDADRPAAAVTLAAGANDVLRARIVGQPTLSARIACDSMTTVRKELSRRGSIDLDPVRWTTPTPRSTPRTVTPRAVIPRTTTPPVVTPPTVTSPTGTPPAVAPQSSIGSTPSAQSRTAPSVVTTTTTTPAA